MLSVVRLERLMKEVCVATSCSNVTRCCVEMLRVFGHALKVGAVDLVVRERTAVLTSVSL